MWGKPHLPMRHNRLNRIGTTPASCLHTTELRCAIGVLALVGTSKGLFLLRGDEDRQRWLVDGPLLEGWGVYHATRDPRDGMMYAATNHRVYGSTVQRSGDTGRTWARSTKIPLPEDSQLTLGAAWPVRPGWPLPPETLY